MNLNSANFHCTATMAALSNNLRGAGLKQLAKQLLGANPISYQEAKNDSRSRFLRYALEDATFTYQLFPILSLELVEKDLWNLYSNVERPFLMVNLECQRNGICFDVVAADRELERLQKKIVGIKNSLGSPETNWASHVQVKQKVYGDFELPLAFFKGKLSVGKKALQTLCEDPRVRSILDMKAASAQVKQISSLKKFVDPNTSRIHPFIHTLGADTGRATSSCPNLQNIDKKSILRQLFISRPYHRLVVVDFSQIEPRVLAHFLETGNFKNIFNSDEDFYSVIRSSLRVPGAEPATRDVAKTVVLATLYGMGAKTLSEQLKIPKDLACELLSSFFRKFPEIVAFRSAEIEKAKVRGYTVGLLNRRRYINGLNDLEDSLRFRAERQVLNSIVQGSAATLFKYKLVQLRRSLPAEVRFLHHVHDEIVLEAPSTIAGHILSETIRILEQPVEFFSTRIRVEGGIGENWSEAKGGLMK